MSALARFSGAKNAENTQRQFQNDFQQPAFAATIALAIKGNAAKTVVKPATLTGVVTFTANVGDANNPPYVGDEIEFFLTPDGTTRVATFGTGFLPTATLSVTTAKQAFISFKFNGTAWIETARAVNA